MSWSRFDDHYAQHPKLVALGAFFEVGLALDVAGIGWCNLNHADGKVPKAQVPRLITCAGMRIGTVRVTPELVAARLVAVGRWDDLGDAYSIHDFLEYNPSRAEVEAQRRAIAERAIVPQFRREVIERDGLICGLCGGDVEPTDVHVDHIQPVSRGGRTIPENLQVTHSSCNLRKGAQWPGDQGAEP